MLYCHTTSALKGTNREELFQRWYNFFVEEHGREPGVVTVHIVRQRYGGPEEGGWYYEERYPWENHCVFSKEQAIKVLSELSRRIEADDDEEEYALDLSSTYAEHYPKHRPHYE